MVQSIFLNPRGSHCGGGVRPPIRAGTGRVIRPKPVSRVVSNREPTRLLQSTWKLKLRFFCLSRILGRKYKTVKVPYFGILATPLLLPQPNFRLTLRHCRPTMRKSTHWKIKHCLLINSVPYWHFIIHHFIYHNWFLISTSFHFISKQSNKCNQYEIPNHINHENFWQV